MFNKERFHNELAMRLGYERIVNNKRILISVEESDEPVVTLKVEDGDEIRIKITDSPEGMGAYVTPEIREIIDAVYQAFIIAINRKF